VTNSFKLKKVIDCSVYHLVFCIYEVPYFPYYTTFQKEKPTIGFFI